ncbi:MAG: hypothetical protein U0Q16_25395 [Bryobacteraceae bacterium]
MQNYITWPLRHRLLGLWRDRKAQDMIEYALLAAFLTVAVAAFFPTDIAPHISQVFSKITDTLNKAPSV